MIGKKFKENRSMAAASAALVMVTGLLNGKVLFQLLWFGITAVPPTVSHIVTI